MALTLTDIQTSAQFHAKDRNLTLTSGQGLSIANECLIAICLPKGEVLGRKVGQRWRELTVVDTSLTTVANQEAYSWPSLPAFLEDPFIEYVRAASTTTPFKLLPIPTEDLWMQYAQLQAGWPEYYRLYMSGGVLKFAMRANPNTTGDTIRITGIRQPDLFVNGSSKTPWRNQQVDYALARLIAAQIKHQRGDTDYAGALVQEAIGLLPDQERAPMIDDNRIVPWPRPAVGTWRTA